MIAPEQPSQFTLSLSLSQARVAVLAPPSYDWVVMMRAVWRAGGVFVPLCVSHPSNELQYTLKVHSPISAHDIT